MKIVKDPAVQVGTIKRFDQQKLATIRRANAMVAGELAAKAEAVARVIRARVDTIDDKRLKQAARSWRD